LRALRFAGRFDFKLSKSTERLLRQAVNMGMLEEAPVGRILNELRLALKEDNIIAIFRLYRKYKILEHIFKGFRWDGKTEEGLFKLKRVIDWFSIEFPSERFDLFWLYILLILQKIDYNTAEATLRDMSAPSWVRKGFRVLYSEGHILKRKIREAKDSYELYSFLKPYHPAVLLFLMTDDDISERIKLFLERLRFIKPTEEEILKLKEEVKEGKALGEKIEDLKRKKMLEEAPLRGL